MSKSLSKYIVVGSACIGFLTLIFSSDAKVSTYNHAAKVDDDDPYVVVDTPKTTNSQPTQGTQGPVNLHYNFQDNSEGDPLTYPGGGSFMLNNPSNVHTTVDYDPTTNEYDMTQKMGDMDYRPPIYMESEEYQDYMFKKQVKDYWNARAHADSKNKDKNTLIPKLHVGGEIFDRIFGGNTVDIKPNGSAELIFAYNGTRTQNPALPVKQQKIHTFDFNEKIQLNVVGKIGDKLKLTTSYNTEATFDFENQMKLEYTGYEDEIIKKIEAGNVSMPLSGSLITGSQTLFGVKTQLQFGRMTVTAIVAQEKGKKSEVNVAGGAQVTKYQFNADNYEANKHFFLGQYFRDHYNDALAGLPFINSPINITKIEVWVTNVTNVTTDVRSIVGFSELGESAKHIPAGQTHIQDSNNPNYDIPFNGQNTLYSHLDTFMRQVNVAPSRITAVFGGTLIQQTNFEVLSNAKKLQPSEYAFNAKLGYISLNQTLNPDQVLCVAYQYTDNGKTYQVGEFSSDGIVAPQALFVKMLKASVINTRQPLWKLMMKNVYSIGAYQVQAQDFKLDVFYNNSSTGTYINYLPVSDCQTNIKAKPLLQVIGLDRLDAQNDQQPDGVYDFVDGVTINAANGRVFFPNIEPFGSYLNNKFLSSCSPSEASKYVFQQLYDSTRIEAQQLPNLDRFQIRGSYKSQGGSDISLGSPNIPQGSVTVTAGGVKLTENVDYTVDYTLGRVKIINEGILNSGTPIKVSLESNAMFAIQQKTLMGSHFDYKFNKDFSLGGTVMNLKERPLTQKVNIGSEPIDNTLLGVDGNYRTEVPVLTRLINKLPFINTKEMSTITSSAEYAYMIPGHNKAIGKDGTAYIDDFEGSTSYIDLRAQGSWNIASTPQGQSSLFPETAHIDTSLTMGYNRAKLAFYVIDPLFLTPTNGLTPGYINSDSMSNNFERLVPQTEVFPNEQSPTGVPVNIATLDLAYYPNLRGPYNYDPPGGKPPISAGLKQDGTLNNPASRWGGITRAITTNDFEAANIEYIQFWVMDPFNADNPQAEWNTQGNLYFNLGDVSEDVLHDNYKSAENGLPAPSTYNAVTGNVPTLTTAWGVVPGVQPLVNAFNSDPGDRPYQDVGLDGLTDGSEQGFFNSYVNNINGSSLTQNAKNTILSDVSGDDYHYFRGDDYDNEQLGVLGRYQNYNGLEGNSAIATGAYPTAATTLPSTEDVNHDNNLNTVESYYQYHISLKPNDFASGVGTNYITNVFQTYGQAIQNGSTKPIKWYQFKIPIKTPEAKIGGIDNFQSIRFMRMFFQGVDKRIILRFAQLELVRDEWRKYGFDLLSPGLYIPNDNDLSLFDVSAVNLEENGNKTPVNYVLPPGISRQINTSSANLTQLNEQSLAYTFCNLPDGEARAAYKITQLDVRNYKTLQMYIHGEAPAAPAQPLNNGDVQVFIRLGTDFTDNYYEYDVPVMITPPGTYNGSSEDDQYKVWPYGNEMVLDFVKLTNAKLDRNNRINGKTVSLTTDYTEMDGSRTIVVRGNPTISAIMTIMIGVRNPKKMGPGTGDDGLPKCGAVWMDELRLTGFIEQGGSAAIARVTAKLADLGNVSLSGNMYTPGWGSLENTLDQLKQEELKQYDFSSSLELGKFLPKDLNFKIPMYVGYSETFITPKYNPLDPDIKLKPELNDKDFSKHYRDSLKNITEDYTRRKSITFTNVKKEKGKNAKKSHLWDISNFATSYSYNEIYKHDVNTEYNILKNYRGGIMYSYSPKPKNIKPFDKISFLQSNYFAIIRDINFYLLPSKFGFSSDLTRMFATAKNRDVTGEGLIILPTYNKTFNFNRNYDLKYDITKGLKVDFTAANIARVFESQGDIDTQKKKDTILTNLRNLGQTSNYNQQFNVTYTVPINKLPFLDFTSASVKYGATYTWTHSPLYNTQYERDAQGNNDPVIVDTLGNVIQNSQNIQYNGQLNMATLYNRFPYFKRVNALAGANKNADSKSAKQPQDPKPMSPSDTTKKKKNPEPHGALLYLARVAMTIKTVTGTYSDIHGMMLPGYKQGTQAFGMDDHFQGPTAGFVFGSQRDIRQEAVDNDWLVKTQSLNTPYTTMHNTNLNIRANLEPMPDLKIELTETRTQTHGTSEFFRWVIDTMPNGERYGSFQSQSFMETGNYSVSYASYRTSFMKADNVFQNFLSDRQAVSQKLGSNNPNSHGRSGGGYADGYNSTAQDVLIPAFIAAYSGKKSSSTNEFPSIPKPNWRVTYDGLSKLKQVKKHFKAITLSHAYRSSYNVGSYTSNLLYQPDGGGHPFGRDTSIANVDPNRNFIPKNLINTVTISEQWSPLIKVEVTLLNSISLNFEFKKDRNISLGLTSNTITELDGREIICGAGYRIPKIKLFKWTIKGKPIKSDLNLKADLSFRTNITTVRNIAQDVSEPTGGTNIISIKTSADYVISDRVSIRLFYDHIINKPVISSSFPTQNTNAGISIRLSLSN